MHILIHSLPWSWWEGRHRLNGTSAISPMIVLWHPHLNMPPFICLAFGESMQRSKQKKQKMRRAGRIEMMGSSSFIHSQKGFVCHLPHKLLFAFFLLAPFPIPSTSYGQHHQRHQDHNGCLLPPKIKKRSIPYPLFTWS